MFNKRYLSFKILIIGLIIIFFIIIQVIDIFYLQKTSNIIIIDAIAALIFSILLIELIFKIITKKENQLKNQIEQLTDAYQYIGQINRKIDALLELDISNLDRSKKYSLNESSTDIFNQLLNLVQAKAGYLYFRPPIDFKFYQTKIDQPQIKKTFEKLITAGIKEFKYSQNKNNQEFFESLNIEPEILKKYDFLTKPIYMHDKDVGIMVLAFKKNQQLETRDFNIIRIYSFYLALNYTFKPDFSIYQT